MKNGTKTASLRALQVFKANGGILKTNQALKAGIHPATLYQLRDQGKIETVGRGIHKIAHLDIKGDPNLIQIFKRFPKAVLCLISALDFHGLTTQIPRVIHLAIEKGTHQPKLDYPPCSFFSISEKQFSVGIQVKDIHGVKVRVYDPEKTIVDCFKFRNRIGHDVGVEALKKWNDGKKKNIKLLTEYAKICRVEKILRPYLEALI